MSANLLTALTFACAAHPEQRVAQVIVIALGVDPFYMEDDQAEKRLWEYAETGRPA